LFLQEQIKDIIIISQKQHYPHWHTRAPLGPSLSLKKCLGAQTEKRHHVGNLRFSSCTLELPCASTLFHTNITGDVAEHQIRSAWDPLRLHEFIDHVKLHTHTNTTHSKHMGRCRNQTCM
jgi:hypothetical protein